MRLLLRHVLSGFLRWAETTLAPATVHAYRHHLKRFQSATRTKDVRRLRPMHLSQWGKSWHEYQAVIRAFNWAVGEAKLLRRNPFQGMRLPCRNQRKRIMTPREMAIFLRGCRRPGRQFLVALRETFARPQEIRAARWDDVIAEDGSTPMTEALLQGKALIVLHEFKDRRRRKDSSRSRVLLINRRLGRLLVRLWQRRTEDVPEIFLNSRGRPWTKNAVRLMAKRLRRRLGVVPDKRGETVVAYTWRHSCATLAAAGGIRDRVLADLLGHVETRTTARYQHLNVGHLREALARLRPDRCQGQ